jgi:hypothetical protein
MSRRARAGESSPRKHERDAGSLGTPLVPGGEIMSLTTTERRYLEHRLYDERGAAIAARRSSELSEINVALYRLMRTPHRYGVCENTGRDIPFERLDVTPWATSCVDSRARTEWEAQAEFIDGLREAARA